MFMVREAPVVIERPLQDASVKKKMTACRYIPRGETSMNTKFN